MSCRPNWSVFNLYLAFWWCLGIYIVHLHVYNWNMWLSWCNDATKMSCPTYKYRVDISYMFWSNYKVQYNLFQKKDLIALRKGKGLEHAYCSRVTDCSQINKKCEKKY